MSRPPRTRFPRRIRPGALPRVRPNDELRCLALSHVADEWIGVDLATGAFVRVPGSIDPSISGVMRPALAVRFTVAKRSESLDPTRPELVEPATTPVVIGRPKARAVRRFLGRLATPEVDGAMILGTRGPSIAFIDLDGSGASLQLLATGKKDLELSVSERDDPICVIPWGGTTGRTRIVDEYAAHAAYASAPRPLRGAEVAAALGYRPSFILIGLGRVTEGHVPKLVLALL